MWKEERRKRRSGNSSERNGGVDRGEKEAERGDIIEEWKEDRSKRRSKKKRE